MSIVFGLHVLAAAIWVGGMFFAYVALRPSAAQLLDPSQRMPLWSASFQRFFPWVWVIVVTLPATGYWMVFRFFGGMRHVDMHIHIMQGLGILMILLFMHLFFVPYRRLSRAVQARDFKVAGQHLASIRKIMATNLALGLIVVFTAAAGRYW